MTTGGLTSFSLSRKGKRRKRERTPRTTDSTYDRILTFTLEVGSWVSSTIRSDQYGQTYSGTKRRDDLRIWVSRVFRRFHEVCGPSLLHHKPETVMKKLLPSQNYGRDDTMANFQSQGVLSSLIEGLHLKENTNVGFHQLTSYPRSFFRMFNLSKGR